jgi:hypothetical protein
VNAPASSELTVAERWKLLILAEGLRMTDRARRHLDERNDHRALTPADYASTSGLIVVVDGDVWVNAPTVDHNSGFVVGPSIDLDVDDDGALSIGTKQERLPARVWLPPAYHGADNEQGEPYNSYAFTHADRVRISPIEGCSMTCKFCDLPYEFRYRTKRIEGLVDAVAVAVADPLQPAHHVLISGGTPKDADIGYVRDCYEAVVRSHPNLPVDVMMVPIADLMDPVWLHTVGVKEISVNLEIFDLDLARRLMRQKAKQGRDHYLTYLETAAGIFPAGHVRSMLMVGLEPLETTLAGVRAIAERGAVPVLSPFRPDPATPLRDEQPPTAAALERAYLEAREIVADVGGTLGPSCIPCTHNTLTFSTSGSGFASRSFGEPVTV